MTSSNHMRMLTLSDDFFRLALGETDGFHYGGLVGIRSCAAILEDDGLEEYINRLLDLLKEAKA